MSEVAWVRHVRTGDHHRIEREPAGTVTRASSAWRIPPDGSMTGPPTNLPDDPEAVGAINAHPEDYEEVPLTLLYQAPRRS